MYFSHTSKLLALCTLSLMLSAPVEAQHSDGASSAAAAASGGPRARWISGGAPSGTARWNGHSEPLVEWDECSGRIKGGYNGDYTTQHSFKSKYPASSSWKKASDVKMPSPDCTIRPVSTALFKFMDEQLPKCVAKATGITESEIESLNIAHVGVKGDDAHRSKSRGSYHNISRAIDVTGFSVKVATESSPRVFNHSMGAYANYKSRMGQALNAAEAEQLKFFKDLATCVKGSGGGTIGFENAKHQGHIHISVPSQTLINKGFYRQ
jgi:hypothetical protein